MTFGKAFISCFVVMTAVEMPNGVEALKMEQKQTQQGQQQDTINTVPSEKEIPKEIKYIETQSNKRIVDLYFAKKKGKKDDLYTKYEKAVNEGKQDAAEAALKEMAKVLNKFDVALCCNSLCYGSLVAGKLWEKGWSAFSTVPLYIYALMCLMYLIKYLLSNGSFGLSVEEEESDKQ